jgi:S-adenosylmethionine decarboxylase
MMMKMGIHLLVNLYGCPKEKLEKSDVVLGLLNDIVSEANLNKVGEQSHQFEPFGATAVVLLAESHISIHTWPENGSAAVDIFCCATEGDVDKVFDVLVEKFKPQTFDKKRVER